MIENLKKYSKYKKYLIAALPVFVLLALFFTSDFSTRQSYAPPKPIIEIKGDILDGYVFQGARVEVSFSDEIPNYVRDAFTVSFSPDVKSDLIWTSTNTFTITPRPSLAKKTDYTFKVLYEKNVIGSTEIKVSSQTLDEVDEEIRVQAQHDIEYAEKMKGITTEFPWYYSMPIITDGYTIVYDYDLAKFRIRLNIDKPAPQETVDTLTKQALVKLSTTPGVPANFEHYVLFRNE